MIATLTAILSVSHNSIRHAVFKGALHTIHTIQGDKSSSPGAIMTYKCISCKTYGYYHYFGVSILYFTCRSISQLPTSNCSFTVIPQCWVSILSAYSPPFTSEAVLNITNYPSIIWVLDKLKRSISAIAETCSVNKTDNNYTSIHRVTVSIP